MMGMSMSSSKTKRHFRWTTKVGNNYNEADTVANTAAAHHQHIKQTDKRETKHPRQLERESNTPQAHVAVVSRLRSVVNRALGRNTRHHGQRVVLGTLFGNKHRDHIYFAIQNDSKSRPAFLIDLAIPITGLVGEMGSGSVRIAFQSEKKNDNDVPLLGVRAWMAYCNGMLMCGARNVDCGVKETRVLKAVDHISVGAGVLPSSQEGGLEEEVVYMRAKFERVVGSRHSQALYMLNPDNVNAVPELTIYFLRL
ncbi:hypothetical protein OROMI_033895 [Orobanche minor]